jgi:polysaccharide pyruvyl transferase WcaK-like protein
MGRATMAKNDQRTSPRIAFVNVWSDQNRGDAAIVIATCDAVKRLYPNSVIDMHNVAFGPKELEKQRETHFSAFNPDQYKLFPAIYPALKDGKNGPYISRKHRILFSIRTVLILILGWFHPGLPLFLLNKEERTAYRALIDSDLVISKGGSYLLANSWKDLPQILMVMFPLMIASIMKKRTLLLGVSIGPASSKISSLFLRFCLSFVDQIVLREEYALKTCKRLKIPEEKLTLLPDMALFSVACETTQPETPDFLKILSRPVVGVTVRRWPFDDVGNRTEREPKYFESVATALKTFQNSTEGTVLFIPQVIGPNEEGSDLGGIQKVMEHLEENPNFITLPRDLSVNQLRAIYAHLDLLVGTRLHSCLMGFGTPTTMIGYQGDKSIGSAELLGCSDRFVHINEITAESLLNAIQKTWDERESIRQDAKKRLTAFRNEFYDQLPAILSIEGFPIKSIDTTHDSGEKLILQKKRNKKNKRSSLLRITTAFLVLMITFYAFRWVQLRKGIEQAFVRRNSFHMGTVDGKLAGYYLEPPLDEKEIGQTGVWKISDDTQVDHHPDLQATLALQHFSYWKHSDNTKKKEIARATFFELSENIQKMFVQKTAKDGRTFSVVEYHFDNIWYPHLKTPWRSSLAQGRCLSVLARHYQEKPNPELLILIKNIITSYQVPVEEDGVKSVLNGYWFYEEVAQQPATHILNGHIIAFWGLYDIYRVTGDQKAFKLFQKGMDAVLNNLNNYDTFPWSTYDFGPHIWAGTAGPKYQLMHACQMKILFEMTEQPEFLKYARQWENELNNWTNQISYLFSRDYYRVTRKVKTICLY